MSSNYLHSEQLIWQVSQDKTSELYKGEYFFKKLKSGLSIHGNRLQPNKSLKVGRLINRYVNLIVLFEGHLRFAINEKRYDIDAGDNGKLILVSPENSSLFTRFLVSNEVSAKIALRGIERWLDDNIQSHYPSLYQTPVRIRELNAEQRVKSQRFLKLIMDPNTSPLLTDYSALKLLDELWANFADECSKINNAFNSDSFNDFVQQLSIAYQPRLNSHELAARLHLTVRTLQRRINRYFGCSLREWMHHEKMIFALQALRQNTLSISEISYECGYKHVSNFTQAFKQYFHCTPAEIRKP
ncbi:helix-turn-helix domain-containing protein [Oligella urethralis]|uniref:HTH araC/xylS-type domain-containing protein n=1 Tax=Oligella urethralis DNF00040 TaxID=1401065 RepID=A0A095Z813_9BURK|nr:helix-turn-helix domain-containing protein [Oligella urethralis]KGF30506.1 hypothetical protein HMPREF2130_06765 [Oligella urethralis DNF00040]